MASDPGSGTHRVRFAFTRCIRLDKVEIVRAVRACETVRSSAVPPEIGIDDALSSAMAPSTREGA